MCSGHWAEPHAHEHVPPGCARGGPSRRQLEQAVRAASVSGPGSGSVKVRAVITIPELGMEHVIEGEISTGGAE